jgi:uncharacterized membrane protein YccC
MLSSFIPAMGFLDRFQADFAGFANFVLAQMTGIITTLVVTKLFRSASLRWRAHQIVHRNWSDLAQLADPREPLDAQFWTAHATDRLGQLAARMALISSQDALHAADGLIDLRIGRNIIQLRRALAHAGERMRITIQSTLTEVSRLYLARTEKGKTLAAPPSLLDSLDRAINVSMDAAEESESGDSAVLALVSMRCNLFPHASPPRIDA